MYKQKPKQFNIHTLIHYINLYIHNIQKKYFKNVQVKNKSNDT